MLQPPEIHDSCENLQLSELEKFHFLSEFSKPPPGGNLSIYRKQLHNPTTQNVAHIKESHHIPFISYVFLFRKLIQVVILEIYIYI